VTEKIIPFTWSDFDELDTMEYQYYDVRFYDDFGPFKKGDSLDFLVIDYGSCVVYNDDIKLEWQAIPKMETVQRLR
jgi:hypothetical protein